MKLNPLIAKTPDDFKTMEFKKMKALIKKELKRLQKMTTAEKPTQFMIIGEHDYTDKKGMALPIFGNWKGKFKEYAKKEVVKDPCGAIGTVYFDKIDENGQKVIQIQLAKGKGKTKVGKIERTLKKLIPQAAYNVVFNEISEDALDALEQQLDGEAEQDETFEAPDMADSGEIDVKGEGLDLKKLLTSNLKEITNTLADVKATVIPKIKAKTLTSADVDKVENLLDLCLEWQEIYDEAAIFTWTKASFLLARGKVELMQQQLEGLLPKMRVDIPDVSEEEATEETGTLAPAQIQFEMKGAASNLSAKADQVLREILATAGEPKATIVNTLRTEEQQASVMLMNIKAYGAEFNKTQYKDKNAAKTVVEAYEAALAAGKSEQEQLGAILAAIRQVGAAKLSDHCNASNPAIDIHPSSILNKSKFEATIKADGRVTVICPPLDTTYHIIVK